MKRYILVVEDEQEISQAIIRRIISKYDEKYEPLVCVDGFEALEFMRLKNPIIVILDIRMQNLDGIAVCKRAKKDVHMKKIPIIVSSGHASEENKKFLRFLGIHHFVDKPYSMDQLFQCIETVISDQNHNSHQK